MNMRLYTHGHIAMVRKGLVRAYQLSEGVEVDMPVNRNTSSATY